MEGKYFIDKKIRNRYLKKYVKNVPLFKKKRRAARIFYGVAVLILLGFLGVYFIMPLTDFLIFFGVGIVFGVIPFAIGMSIKIKAFIACGEPYTTREKECLVVYPDGLEFSYHYTQNEYPDSLDIYRIPIENINAVLYDAEYHILTIIGAGELLSYDDIEIKRLNIRNSQRKFCNNSPYEIMLGMENAEEIAETVKKMAKH